MIRVLVAEDSRTARELLLEILSRDAEIKVCGVAENGAQAVNLVKQLRPDVVIMDIQMPELDGFEATKAIMAQAPVPIVIVSGNRDVREISVAIEALRAGALTALPKPHGLESPRFAEESDHLLATVKAMSAVAVVRRRPHGGSAPPWTPRVARPPRLRGVEVVVAAASTGGPATLHRLLSDLPPDFEPPVLIVQHLSEGFIGGFAAALARSTPLRVSVAQHLEVLAPRSVYLAPYGSHLVIRDPRTMLLVPPRLQDRFCPSANMLFESAARVFGAGTVAIVLTGMGTDGVEGSKAVKQVGGEVLAQDESTSVIFGMPKEVIDAGLADRVLPIGEIAPWLTSLTRKN